MLSEQQQRILGYFIEEAKDHLNTIEQGLLNLQGTIEDSEMVSEVFRAAHSVKGGAAMLGLNSIQQTAHRLEDYFKVLKECPIQVDQKLENFFFTIFDGLKELLEQLQGPFGLTDDKAEEVMTGLEPTFQELGEHLSFLVSQSGGVPPEEVQLPGAATAVPTIPVAHRIEMEESSALHLMFQSDVPTRLRDMLQLFKQAETPDTRQQLEALCRSLASTGEQFDLTIWCELCETARQAIACPENDYRTLAPVVIKAIKQAQDLVVNGRATEVVISDSLQALVPISTAADDAAMDFDALLAAMDTDDSADESVVELIDFGLVSETAFEEELAIASDQSLDFDSDFDFLTATDEGSLDEGSLGDLSEDALGLDELQLDTSSSDSGWPATPDDLGLDPSGPEVGAAELNSLADLFEGEMPDLGLTWQEEEVIGSFPTSNHSRPFESGGDFDDLLLDQDDGLDELDLDDEASTDLSALLSNGDAPATRSESNPTDLPFGTEGAESLADLLSTVEEEEEALSATEEPLFADLDGFSDIAPSSEWTGNDLDIAASPWDDPVDSDAPFDSRAALESLGYGPEDDLVGFEETPPIVESVLEPPVAVSAPEGDTPDSSMDTASLNDLFADPFVAEDGTSAAQPDDLADGDNYNPSGAESFWDTDEMAVSDLSLGHLLEEMEEADAPALESGFTDGSATLDMADLFSDGAFDPESESGDAGEFTADLSDAEFEALMAGDSSADESFLDAFGTIESAPDPSPEHPDDPSNSPLFDLADVSDGDDETIDASFFDELASLTDEDDLGDSLFEAGEFGSDAMASDSAWASLDFEDTLSEQPASTAEVPEESLFESFDLAGSETLDDSLWEDAATPAHPLDAALDEPWSGLEDSPVSPSEAEGYLSDAALLSALELDTPELTDPSPDLSLEPLASSPDAESFWETSDTSDTTDATVLPEDSLLDLLESDAGEDSATESPFSTLNFDESLGEASLSDPDNPSDPWMDLTGMDEESDLSAFSELVDLPEEEDLRLDLSETLFPETVGDGDESIDLSILTDAMAEAEVFPVDGAAPVMDFSDVASDLHGEVAAEAMPMVTDSEDSFDIDALFDADSTGEGSTEQVDEAIADLFDSSAEDGVDLNLLNVLDQADSPVADQTVDQSEDNLEFLGTAFGELETDLDLNFDSTEGTEEFASEDLASEDLPLEDQTDWMNFGGLESSNAVEQEFDSSLDSLDLGELAFSDMMAAPTPTDEDSDLSAMIEAATEGRLEDNNAPFDFDALLGEVDRESSEPGRSPATSSSDDFADLESLLSSPDQITSAVVPDSADDEVEDDEFANLEALLDDVSVPDPSMELGAETLTRSEPSEFDDLERLLEDADQALGGPPSSRSTRRPSMAGNRRQPRRGSGTLADQTMRVSVKNLDNLNNLVGELVVNRNSLEQAEERLRQFLDNLLYQVQQLSDVGQRMRDLYERSLLESSLLSSRKTYQMANPPGATPTPAQSHATGMSFDALEMDRFTGFHTLSQEMIELIVRVRESASDIDFVVDETDQITRNFRQITTQLQEGLTRSRMVPFGQTADRLPRAVRDISLKCGKQAELVVEGRDTLIDKMILEQLYDPMTHLVNNAITHGIETAEERLALGKSATGRITVRTFHQGNQTVIAVTDDGAGIDPEMVKRKAVEKRLITPRQASEMTRLDVYDLLFHHGFSTRDKADDFAGRGVGMDVVRTSLNEIRGVVNIDSTIGQGTTFTIRLPLTLSISKALCCISNRARIAFPMDGVEDMLDVPKERILRDDQGRPCIQWRDTLLPFSSLSELLKYNRSLGRGSVYGGNQEEDIVSVVVLRSAGNYLALQVDQVLGEQEIVIKQLEGPVPKPIGVAGATVLGDGRIMPIADVLELIDLSMGRIRRDSSGSLWEKDDTLIPIEVTEVKTEPTVLIVDDSITVRELLSMTFNKVGYRVEQARDGQEAWEKLRSGLPCDLVFCDIEMPRMDGLELLSRIQKDTTLSHLPIAMLTSRGADRHRQMAIQLGAKGYFTKPYLEEALLDAAQRMLKGEWLIGGS